MRHLVNRLKRINFDDTVDLAKQMAEQDPELSSKYPGLYSKCERIAIFEDVIMYVNSSDNVQNIDMTQDGTTLFDNLKQEYADYKNICKVLDNIEEHEYVIADNSLDNDTFRQLVMKGLSGDWHKGDIAYSLDKFGAMLTLEVEQADDQRITFKTIGWEGHEDEVEDLPDADDEDLQNIFMPFKYSYNEQKELYVTIIDKEEQEEGFLKKLLNRIKFK